MRSTFTNLNNLRVRLEIDEYHGEFLYWGYYSGQEWWRNYMHSHSFFEICYVLEGEGEFTINENTVAVEKGDLFIAKPNELHEIISSEKAYLAIYYWAYTLIPPSKTGNSDLARLFNAFALSEDIIHKKSHTISVILTLLNREVKKKRIGYEIFISTLTKQLIIETSRAYTKEITSKTEITLKSRDAFIVATIVQYLKDNYAIQVNLKQVAAQVHLSERHVSRLFKREVGVTIIKYALGVRLNIAKQLLLDSNAPIYNVAYETGFTDAQHFSTVFRKNVGTSPSMFRLQKGTKFMGSQ